MIEGEQGEGFIYKIIANSNTLTHIEEIMDTDLNETTLASPFEGVEPLGARDPDYNVEAYGLEENANVWAEGDMDMDIGMNDVNTCPSFLCCSSF